jgi:hypothetical protein
MYRSLRNMSGKIKDLWPNLGAKVATISPSKKLLTHGSSIATKGECPKIKWTGTTPALTTRNATPELERFAGRIKDKGLSPLKAISREFLSLVGISSVRFL